MKKLLIIPVIVFSLYSCKDKPENYSEIKADEPVSEEIVQEHPGKKLMETQCYICHSPDAPMNDGRIAPPMVAIKAHYLDVSENKTEFIANIRDFLDEPSAEKSQMPGAISKFGLMPYQKFSEESISQIGEYLYDYQIEAPDWFEAHYNENRQGKFKQRGKRQRKRASNVAPSASEKGLNMALNTKKVLGKNLMQALQTKGTKHALAFCNTRAMPLTDSMALKNNATIKRVSDRYRNPKNKANKTEIAIIEDYNRGIAEGLEPSPIVITKNNLNHFYYPIITNSMCLQCHGKPENIDTEVKDMILKLYPEDKALGYAENEVRGIWSIQFN